MDSKCACNEKFVEDFASFGNQGRGCLFYPLICFFLRNSCIDAARSYYLRLRHRRNVRPVMSGKMRS